MKQHCNHQQWWAENLCLLLRMSIDEGAFALKVATDILLDHIFFWLCRAIQMILKILAVLVELPRRPVALLWIRTFGEAIGPLILIDICLI